MQPIAAERISLSRVAVFVLELLRLNWRPLLLVKNLDVPFVSSPLLFRKGPIDIAETELDVDRPRRVLQRLEVPDNLA